MFFTRRAGSPEKHLTVKPTPVKVFPVKDSPAKRCWLDLSDLGFVYGLLCALSLVAINPWGRPRGEIWTDPKVYAVIALALLSWSVLLVQLVRFIMQRLGHGRLSRFYPPPAWGWAAFLWAAYLGFGLLSVYFSPVKTSNALMPNNEMGDGWVYWAYVAAFVLGNALVLKRFPQLFRAQLYGFLVAGLVTGLAVIAQTIDWRLDFTATMGKVVPGSARVGGLLYSNIYGGQMPIGLTSHRGHAGFIVAAIAVLVLVGMVRGWVAKRYGWPLYLLLLAGVYLTSTRGAQAAFIAGLIYLLIRFWRTQKARQIVLLAFIPLVLGGAGLLGAVALGVPNATRSLPPLAMLSSNPDAFTSFRLDYWRIAADGIRERPLLGWGYNGFGLAFPYVNNFEKKFKRNLELRGNKAIEIDTLRGTDHYYFRYIGTDGLLHLGRVLSNKAHNLILDVWVSLGLGGLITYLLLLGVFLGVTARGEGWGLEAVAVVYLVYTLTWFESAQFSHLTWWVFSAGLAMQRLPQGVVARAPFVRRFGTSNQPSRN